MTFSIKPKFIFKIWLTAVLGVLASVGLAPHVKVTPILAQTGVVWSDPIMLSTPGIKANPPTIVTDVANNVHIMWSQTMASTRAGDTLYYTRRDGKTMEWSKPIDVLVSPSPEDGAIAPELAVTPDGMLHAIWNTGGLNAKLLYARAPACCADNPKNWSSPKLLGSPVQSTAAMVADRAGRLHVAFASQETKGIVYLRSDDGGDTWPVWVDIRGGMTLSEDFSIYPRLAVDGRGRVHLVWSVLPYPGRAAMYARSDDGGDTWNDSEIIDLATRKDYENGYGPIYIDVEAHGNDEIHLIWDGAPTVNRNHVWSSDGGETWSDINLLFPEVTGAGRSGWNDMAFDSAGILHAVSLKATGPPLHATWDGHTWSNTDRVVSSGPAATYTELLRVAISHGNRVNVTWLRITGDRLDTVWYAQGIASAPEVAAQPLPTVISPAPTTAVNLIKKATPTAIAATPTTVRPQYLTSATDNIDIGASSSPTRGIIIGLIPAVLLIGIVIGVKLWWKEQ